MSTKIKSMLKFQWVSILPTFLTTSSLLAILSISNLYQLYLPISLGIISGGVVDFDNKFSGKVWNALTVFSFFLIAELVVFYTYHNFPLLAVTTIVSCFCFIMLGSWSKTLKTIGFGGALIVCYSLFLVILAHNKIEAINNLMWMLFAAVYYTLISLIVHLIFPNRGIKNNISDLYNSLSDFLLVKARFFDPDDDSFEQKLTLRNSNKTTTEQGVHKEHKNNLHHATSFLSSENFEDEFSATIDDKLYNHTYEKNRTALIQQFEVSKESLLIRLKAFSNRRCTADMLRFYLTADTIFKTIDFNVQDYKALKDKLQDTDIMFRIERIFSLYAQYAEKFAYELKTNKTPILDKRIVLSIERLENSIQKQRSLQNYHLDSLQLLLTKLKKVYHLLKNINSLDKQEDSYNILHDSVSKKLSLRTRIQRFISEFSIQSAIFRHACRVSIFLSIAMVIFSFVDIQFSFWFMMAGVLVIQPNYSMTKNRVKMRVYGSILGAIIGATLNFDVQHWPVILGLVTTLTLTLFQFTRILNYGYSTFFLTIAVFCTFRVAGLHVDINTVFQRIFANTAGCLVTWGLIQVIFPEWNFINLGKNVRNAYESNKKFLLTILGLLEGHPIKSFDLNKRQIIAKNAHISLQSVVANVVAEPKIYRLYISPSVRLMALNDYILSNIALINQLVIEHYDSNSLNDIERTTVSLLEKLAIIYTKLYSYNDQELRSTVEELVIVTNSIGDRQEANKAQNDLFDLNHYLRERISGIAVALINYRHELAQIYQISKIDQSILERTHRRFVGIEIFGGALAARANLVETSSAEKELANKDAQSKNSEEASIKVQPEAEQQLATDSNVEATKASSVSTSTATAKTENLPSSTDAGTDQSAEQDPQSTVEQTLEQPSLTNLATHYEQAEGASTAKVVDSEEHYRATEAAIKAQAKNSILDIAAGVNDQSLERIVEHRLDTELSAQENNTDGENLVTTVIAEEVILPSAEATTEELLQEVLTNSYEEDEIAFLSEKEAELGDQIALEVVFHDADEELNQLETLEEQQRLEEEKNHSDPAKGNPNLEIVGYQDWVESEKLATSKDKAKDKTSQDS